MEKKISQERNAEPRVVDPIERLVAEAERAAESGVGCFLVAYRLGENDSNDRVELYCSGKRLVIATAIASIAGGDPDIAYIIKKVSAYLEQVKQEKAEDTE